MRCKTTDVSLREASNLKNVWKQVDIMIIHSMNWLMFPGWVNRARTYLYELFIFMAE